MKPFKLKPHYTDYIWGGTNLKQSYKKETNLSIVAESWELSAHKDGSSTIAECSSQELIGMPFSAFVEKYPHSLGTKSGNGCPILIKLIDAEKDLSIQVHPPDEYALKYEGSLGKTEMWYVLECQPDAFIYMGLNQDMGKNEFIKAVENNCITDYLNRVKVKKGDVFFIEAGTVHAINKGIVLAEIQQNSNLTYRVYDYGRLGADGKPRQLHIAKAADVANLKKYSGLSQKNKAPDEDVSTLASCQYFTVSSVKLRGSYQYTSTRESFASVLIVDGNATLEYRENNAEQPLIMEAEKGDSIFIPAGNGIASFSGNAEFLLTTL